MRSAILLAITGLAMAQDWPNGAGYDATVAPKGANSWDAVEGAYNITQATAASAWLRKTLPSFDTLVLDGGWYGCGSEGFDGFGRPVPCPEPYGNLSLAEVVSAIKAAGTPNVGVWTIRGIPRVAYEGNWPIAGSSYTARDAARLDRNCSWDKTNYGVVANAAGRAWYASLAQHFRSSGISFVKYDCLYPSSLTAPYNDEEVLMIAEELKKQGLTLSFSPGKCVTPGNASQIAAGQLAAQYRVTQDFWDAWHTSSPTSFPSGLWSKADVAATFQQYIGANGTFPDLDMLPIGRIGAHAKAGGGLKPSDGPSPTQFTADEVQYLLTLWYIARAPLMLGAYLPMEPERFASDATALKLLQNDAAMRAHDCAAGSRLVANTTDAITWASVPTDCAGTADGSSRFVAWLNRGDAAASITTPLASLQLSSSSCYCAVELWSGASITPKPVPGKGSIASGTMQPHSGQLLHVTEASCSGTTCA